MGAAAIRPGRDADADGFIALIGACWGEYPGVVLDVDGEMPELRALASYYAGKGGALWAADADGRIVGMIGVVPHSDGAWEIVRLYMLPPYRGTDLAPRLLAIAEAHARAAGATRLVLWSDTRFDRAHRFYEKHSYVRHGPIRVLHDISNSLEFGYAKPVSGIEVLDAAAAASAERRLADILCACVDAGASVSYLPPLAPDVARAFWKRMAADVAAGTRILLAAWDDADAGRHGDARVRLRAEPAAPRRGAEAAGASGCAAPGPGAGTDAACRAGGAARRPLAADARHQGGRRGGKSVSRDGLARGRPHSGLRAERRPDAVRHDLLLEAC